MIHEAVRAAGRGHLVACPAAAELRQACRLPHGCQRYGWGVDSSNDSSWYALRVDDNAIYYFHGGAIIRRLK